MFKEVNPDLENVIAAASTRRGKGPDYSIRTATQWFTFTHHLNFCTIPSHYENVPDTDFSGKKYEKYPSRPCVTIEGYKVCRWCFLRQGDIKAIEAGLKPVERSEV